MDDFEPIVPGGALQGPLFAGLVSRLERAARELNAGERVGPYRIVSRLGRGGSAFVYLAERADGEFEQRVALKLVGTGGDPSRSRELLRHERQVLAGLNHPHIARLLDGGTTSEGWLWFAMEPVQGERIDRHCDSRGLDTVARLRLYLQVCDAVQFAHTRLLVHRDLKPSNILVSDGGEVRLLDFGIALLTGNTSVGGRDPQAYTPGYASPEQRRGETVTTASDVWQLGRLLADCCAMDGDAELQAIATRAMHDEPGRRYVTVAELAADVERRIERRPVHAYAGGGLYRARRFVLRHKLGVGAASMALLAFAALLTWSSLRIARERDQAVREAARANAASEFLRESIWVADPSQSRGDTLTANQILERSAQRVAHELHDQPELRATLLDDIARIHISLGQYSRAEPMLREAVALTRAAASDDPLPLASRLRHLAQVRWRMGAPEQALAAVDEGYALIAALPGNAELRARLLNTRTACELRLGRFAEGTATARLAIALVERELDAGHPSAAYAYNNLATGLTLQDEGADVAPIYARALAAVRARYGDDHPDAYAIGVHYARALMHANRLDESAALLAASRAGLERVHGADHPNIAYALESEAELLHRRGQDRAAAALAERALALHAIGARGDPTERANALRVLADIRAALGEHEIAVTHWREIAALRAAALPAGHPETQRAQWGLAAALCVAGQAGEGRAVIESARNASAPTTPMPATAKAEAAALQACASAIATSS